MKSILSMLALLAFAGCQAATAPRESAAPAAPAVACDSTNRYPDVPRGDVYFEEMLGRY